MFRTLTVVVRIGGSVYGGNVEMIGLQAFKDSAVSRVKWFVIFGITGVPSGHSHRPVFRLCFKGGIQVLL